MSSGFVDLVFEEVRRHVRTPWVLLGVLVLTLGSWTSIVVGERDFNEQVAMYNEQLQVRLQAQLRAPARVFGRAAEPGLRVIRAPLTGAILVWGQDPQLPAAWELTPAGPEALAPYDTIGHGPDGAGQWDLEALVRICGGILALALGMTGVLADKSSGWVGALRALPVPVRTVSAAKIVAGLFTLASLAALWWLAVALVLAATSGAGAAILWRTAPLAASALAYMWIFFGIGAALGWLTQSGLRAWGLGIGVWAVLSVIGPAVVPLIVQMVPAQSLPSLERHRRERYADDMSRVEQVIGRRLSARFTPGTRTHLEVDALATQRFPDVEPEWRAAMAEARATADRAEREWRLQLEAQGRLMAALDWIFPGALVRQAMAELAGTGRSTTRSWASDVRSYQSAMNGALFDDRPIVNLRVPVGSEEWAMAFDRHPAPRFGELPAFVPPDSTWRTTLDDAWGPAAGLVLWVVVALSAAYVASVRTLRG